MRDLVAEHAGAPLRSSVENDARVSPQAYGRQGRGTGLTGPVQSVPSLFDAPRWLWRAMARTYCAYARFAMTSNDVRQPPMSFAGPISPLASRQVRALSWRRELAFLQGMMQGYRALRKR